MDDGSRRHMVYCCHCQHSWGPYAAKYTTTSTFIAHLQIRHSHLSCCESDYKEAVGRILSSATASLGRRSRISPFTLARGIRLGGARAPGQLFNAKEYRKLMAIMVIETNYSFSLVESNAFRTLMAYCNGGAITISRRTLKRDIQSIL